MWINRNLDEVKSWVGGAFGYRQSFRQGIHYSHAFVVLFVATFFPILLSRPDGAWEIIKFWLIPLSLFHIWMAMFYQEGKMLADENDESAPRRLSDVVFPRASADNTKGEKRERGPRYSELRLYLRLLAFLRFQLHVPSYHFTDAIYFLKRVWNKPFDDSPTASTPSVCCICVCLCAYILMPFFIG